MDSIMKIGFEKKNMCFYRKLYFALFIFQFYVKLTFLLKSYIVTLFHEKQNRVKLNPVHSLIIYEGKVLEIICCL